NSSLSLAPPHVVYLLFHIHLPPPAGSTLFPYTTLFRSRSCFASASCTGAAATTRSTRCAPPSCSPRGRAWPSCSRFSASAPKGRSEEHTSELQSHLNLVCRLLLELQITQRSARPYFAPQ